MNVMITRETRAGPERAEMSTADMIHAAAWRLRITDQTPAAVLLAFAQAMALVDLAEAMTYNRPPEPEAPPC